MKLVSAAALAALFAGCAHAEDFGRLWKARIEAAGVEAPASSPTVAANAQGRAVEDEFVQCRRKLESEPPAPPPSHQRQRPRWRQAALPALDFSDPASLAQAAQRTADYWRRRRGAAVSVGGRKIAAAELAAALDEIARLAASGLDGAALQSALSSRFDAYEALPDDGGAGKVTGYCAPEIRIVEHAAPGRAVPLYGMPARDADRRVANGDILDGALAGRAPELFGVPNPMDLSSLQTEGSGWGRLPDGRKVFLKYAGSNGIKWRGVSGALYSCGITKTKLDGKQLSAFVNALSFAQQAEVSALNPSYVFFEALPSGDPTGASDVALNGGRSIAIDPDRVPFGMPAVLVRFDADGGRVDGRVVMAHDKGGAIKGGGRVDLYFGAGDAAEQQADVQNGPDRLYVLVPRVDARGAGR